MDWAKIFKGTKENTKKRAEPAQSAQSSKGLFGLNWNKIFGNVDKTYKGGDFRNINKPEVKALKNDNVETVTVNTPRSMRYVVHGAALTPEQMRKAEDMGYINENTKINLQQLDSTAVKQYRYDKGRKILFVTYVNGDKEYAFPDVPEKQVEMFANAVSKGTMLQNVIKPQYAVKGFRAEWHDSNDGLREDIKNNGGIL